MSSGDEQERLAGLSPAKRALLEQRLRGERSTETSLRAEVRAPNAPTQLSFGQERLWYLHQLDPDSAAYNIHATLYIHGRLALERLRSCLEQTLQRHEVLRTTFPATDGQPIAHISTGQGARVAVEDLAMLSVAEQAEAVRLRSAAQAAAAFELDRGPLARATVLKLSDRDVRLLVTLHHIIADEWSLELLWKELAAEYSKDGSDESAIQDAVEPPTAQTNFEYSDFAAWQRRRAEEGAFDGQLEYWRRQLTSTPPHLRLPSDFNRPAVPTVTGNTVGMTLSSSLTAGIRALARETKVSTFVLLLAAFNTLLARYTGEEDITIGTPVSNRTRTELETLIGFFVNTLPIRTDLSGNPTFLDLVDRVRVSMLGALANQDIPFERLVREFAPLRSRSQNPLFQVMFVLQSHPESVRFGPEITGTVEVEATGAAKFDLTLFVVDRRDHFETSIEFRDRVFTTDSIGRMLDHWQTLLGAIVAAPNSPIQNLPLLSDEERAQLLSAANGGMVSFPSDVGIHSLIERETHRQPDACALLCDNDSVSYGELHERAEKLANRLSALGVGPDVAVGLHVDRSIDMVVGLLGILRAGGAFVPLDPRYPKDRLQQILADACPQVVVSHSSIGESTAIAGADILFVDHEQADELGQNSKRESSVKQAVTGERIAYILYTSGSTGEPKGVQISHRNLVHSTTARDHHYERAPDRFLLLSSVAFDSSLVGIFWTLCRGGTLVLPEPGAERDVGRIGSLIERHAITHVLCLPSLYRILLEYESATLASLHTVIVAGEACAPQVVQRHFEKLPDTHLYNEYGPTEGTVWSTVHQISPLDGEGTVPIGRPIVNTRAIVLDRHGEPVPNGVPGELCIGGEGIAIGYLNRPTETRKAFVPDTFGNATGSRLYRTGDLVRVRGDGNLEFLGRVDRQVKLRGFRIELEEIERSLEAHPEIETAVADLRTTQSVINEIDDADRDREVETLLDRLSALDARNASALVDEIEALAEEDLPTPAIVDSG